MDRHPLFGPIATGMVIVILGWAYSTFQNDGILKADQRRLEAINILEKENISQKIKNKELDTKFDGMLKYIKLLDSKYDKRCK